MANSLEVRMPAQLNASVELRRRQATLLSPVLDVLRACLGQDRGRAALLSFVRHLALRDGRALRKDIPQGDLDGIFAAYRFPTPASTACGIAWDGQCLWVGDLTTKRFYLLDPSDGSVQADFRVPGPPTALPTGILWDGKHVWVVDECRKAPVVYDLQFEFPLAGPCARVSATGGADDAQPDSSAPSEPVPHDDVAPASPKNLAAADARGADTDPGPTDGPRDGGVRDDSAMASPRSGACSAAPPERPATGPSLFLLVMAVLSLAARSRFLAQRPRS